MPQLGEAWRSAPGSNKPLQSAPLKRNAQCSMQGQLSAGLRSAESLHLQVAVQGRHSNRKLACRSPRAAGCPLPGSISTVATTGWRSTVQLEALHMGMVADMGPKPLDSTA